MRSGHCRLVLVLSRHDAADVNSDSYTVVLPPRSLVVMKDEIRYQWRHSVEPVEELRMSVVFRKE